MAAPGASVALIALLIFTVAAVPVAGSYFRYGHLNWRALDNIDDSGKRVVEFSLSLAVKADYSWGEFEAHQWAVGPSGETDISSLDWYGSEGYYKDIAIAPAWDTTSCTQEQQNNLYQQKECFSCGIESTPGLNNFIGCVKQDGLNAISAAQSFYVKFGVTKQANGADVVQCPHAFYCDVALTAVNDDGSVADYTTNDNTDATSDCSYFRENPLFSNDFCAPWDLMHGFFFGDGESHAVVMEMTTGSTVSASEIGPYSYQAVGNYMMGKSTFTHGYNEETTDKFLAFFTGGDRSLECARGPEETHSPDGAECMAGDFGNLLNNNHEGRFRLETEIWIKGGITASPVILMPPVMPVPHMPYGVRSKFQVAAYDPLGNALDFRFANPREMGGIIRSKSEAFPWSEGFLMANSYNSSTYDPVTGKMLFDYVPYQLSQGTQSGTFYCKETTKSVVLGGGVGAGMCQEDRVPSLPSGVTQYSFTSSVPGMVEWNTWLDASGDACTAASSSGCSSRLRNGLYNFVVMATQFTGPADVGVKVASDFLVYLYDGPTYFCNKNCMDSKRATPFPGTPSLLNPASGNYDADGDYAPQFPGVPAFLDQDGVYGVDCPTGNEAACTAGGKLQSQSCTVCGLNAADRNLCTPAQDDGQGNEEACGVGATNGTSGVVSIVPAFTACKMNQVPEFSRVSGVLLYGTGSNPRWILENPGQDRYEASLDGQRQRPVFTAYKYDDVIFALTAVDHDDCTELSIESTAMPDGAVLEEPEYLSDFPEFPEGQMVRRVFRWAGDALQTSETRPEVSMVCFYASDKYLITSQPFYCIEILIQEQPSEVEQTLIRFDCKLSLEWNQLVRRFVVTDAPYDGPVRKFYTKCEFEDYMWHHAMVSVQEDGDAVLYVDGEAQEMVTGIGYDPSIVLQFGRGADVSGGTTFPISAYPNMCPPGFVAPPPPARRLLQSPPSSAPGPDGDATTADIAGGREAPQYGKFQANPISDEPIEDGFLGATDPTYNNTDLGCCSFTVANGCDALTVDNLGGGSVSDTFAGLSDEIVVWNRALSPEEIRESMFKMPQYLPTYKLEAPRGVQMDLTAGRVLYARFNNPCMEGSLDSTPTSSSRRRRRLSQITSTQGETTGIGSSVWLGGVSFEEPRRNGVSDEAGFTSGTFLDADGYLKVRDWDNDTLSFIGWREHAGYAYTGVPWAAPIVHSVEPGGPVPLDGNVEVTVKGIGFARSPFLKCATVQPDVRGEYVMSDAYQPSPSWDLPGYGNRFLNVDGSFLTSSNPWMYDSFQQVQLTRGRTKFAPDDLAPELHPSSYRDWRNKVYNPGCPDNPCLYGKTPRVACMDPANCPELNPQDPQVESQCTFCSVSTRVDWLATNPITSKGKLFPYERISPLPGLMGENYALEYYYGSWETVTCQAPPAAFPSDLYYIGVSNDAGITGSPPNQVTYTEYALKMSDTGKVVTPDVPGRSFSAWFLIEEEAPNCNDVSTQACRTTIFRLSNGVGVSMDYGTVVAKADMKTLGDISGEQFIGSLGTNLTSLGEWHHAMLTIDDSTVRFYLDGVDVIVEELDTPPPADGYKLLSFGDRLVGYIDEVKVFSEVLTFEEYLESMWRREPLPSDRLNAYYRLNNWDDPLADSAGDHHAVCSDGGSCMLESVAAPWEPTTLYAVNGESKLMETMTISGGEVLEIDGFNFAPSQWLGCVWGVFEELAGYSLPETAQEPPMCPPLPPVSDMYKPDTEGKMGRPDGLTAAMEPYGLMKVGGEPAIFVPEDGTVAVNQTTMMRCVTPELEQSGLYYFSPINGEALVTTAFEFVEVSFECDGTDDYLVTSQAAALLAEPGASAAGGYTLSLWVHPYASLGDGGLPMYEQGQDIPLFSPHVPGDPTMGPVTRNLDAYAPVPQSTIATFETALATGGPGQRTTFGSLNYQPGVGFYYYDDCIADVTTSAPPISAEPNAWHFVAVAISAEGDGTLYVDGTAADKFTTHCRVPIDASFSMCASLYENAASDGNLTSFSSAVSPNSFFSGRIDNVELSQGLLEWSVLEAAMFNYSSAGEPVVKYDFSRGCSAADQSCSGGLIRNVAAGATMADATPFDGTLVKSAVPWAGARVLSTSKEGAVAVGGAEEVTVIGHNFAASQWLEVDLGYGPQSFTYVNPTTVAAVTPAGACHDEAEVVVTNAAGKPEGDGDTWATLKYECTTESLLSGLVAFYNLDAPQSSEEDGMYPLTDSVGDAHGRCAASLMAADRDGFLRAAFGSLSAPTGAACSVPPPSSTVSGDYSIAAWVFLPFTPNVTADMTAAGGWKLVTYVVMGSDSATVYLGHQPAPEADAELLLAMMSEFVTTGALSHGIWDDVWVYSRALRPCEVAGRYFTSSYALDLSNEEGEMINGGTKYATILPWGFGSVAAWVYAYNVHDSQTIIAAQDGSFILGLDQGRVNIAITPGPNSVCRCEPCKKHISYTSWKSRVMPGTWHHVSVSYNGFDAYILVDGVLRDKAIVRERCFEIENLGGRRRLMSEESIDAAAADADDGLGLGARRRLQGVFGFGLHPDCDVNGTDPDLPACVYPSLDAQEDVEPTCQPWMLTPDAFMLGREADADFDHPYLAPDNHMRPFNGLIYDVRSFAENAEPFEVKAISQCAPKDPLVGGRGDTYVRFKDGVGSEAHAYTINGKEVTVEGIASSLYRNVSVDETSYPPSTTVYGPGLEGTVNGAPGLFTITARTVCGNKRAVGGDQFTLDLIDTNGFTLNDGFVEISDSNDGTYAVSYTGLPSCGVWNASMGLMVDGAKTEIDMFELNVHPAPTDPTATEAVIEASWTQCSNSLNSFAILARDFNGCPQRDLPDSTSPDTFHVTLRGPADIEAHVTYEGNGQHRALFVPPAAGQYFVEIALMTDDGPVVISNGQQCIQVCGDGSMIFRGTGHVEVLEPAMPTGKHYLDASGLEAFTMEAWVRSDGPSVANAFLLLKGTYAEAVTGAYVKGYSLRYSQDNTRLVAAVYTSNGVLREVEAPNEIASNVWFHVAAVYNGTSFTMYRNGAQVGTSAFSESRPMHHNPYHHPVSVGAGFFGSIDEVKVWSKALTQAEILEGFFCPAQSDMADLLLYLPFNAGYDSGTRTQGYSQWCTPHSKEALGLSCLQAELIQQTVGNGTEIAGVEYDVDSPMTQDGVGLISRRYSFIAGLQEEVTTDSLPSLLTVMSRDRCDYAFVTGTDGLFELRLQKYAWNYFSPMPPGTPYPLRESQGAEQKAETTVVPDTCADLANPTLPYRKGDQHNQMYDFSQAGTYLLKERVKLSTLQGGGDLLEFEENGRDILTVNAGSPTRMQLDGLERTFVAGQPAVVYGSAFDVNNNLLYEPFGFIVEITMVGEPWTKSLESVVSFDELTGRYSIVFTPPHSPTSGAYTLLVSHPDPSVVLQTSPAIPSFRPQPSPWRKVVVNGEEPPATTHRFEHTAVMHAGDMYMFGGALFDKTYLSNLVVLEGADGHMDGPDGHDAFAYRKEVVINTTMAYPGSPVVEVVVNTRELILAGRLTETCTDILFKGSDNGEPLEFYVDAYPGCFATSTLIYVKLPEGLLAAPGEITLTMAYGNAYITNNAYISPKSLFEFHDDFEGEALDPRWQPVESCTMEPMNEAVHRLNHSFAYSGAGSLYVPEAQRGGLMARVAEEVDRFHLRAWFWDSDHVRSAHFVSPDFATCSATANSDATFSRPNNLYSRVTALGTYTMSSRLKYCVGAPWQSAPDVAPVRAAQWRRLEVFSSPETGMTATIDGVTVKTSPAVNASRVFISAGLSVDIPVGANLVGAHAHWDDVTLATWYPDAVVTVSGMDEDTMVDLVEAREWYAVDGNGTNPPPPRYSHSAVVWDDKMWVFGGERSAYAFNDLWSFDFETSRWAHVTPSGEELPGPRYDHSAAVVSTTDAGACMVVVGGRNGHQFLSDMWQYCFASNTWTKLSSNAVSGGRFGHSAAAAPGSDTMFVFGGYTDTGFSMEYFMCRGAGCTDITYGCPEAPGTGATLVAAGITPRYGHSMYATPSGAAIILYGGSNLESKDGLPGVYRFDIDGCSWEKIAVDGPDPSRYEHAVGVSHGGLIVQGGHSAGSYLNDLAFLPVA